MPNTILLKGDLHKRHEEGPAEAACKPGHFVEMIATGKLQKNAAAGADVPLIIVKEDALRGKTINDAYAADDLLPLHHCQSGDLVYARLPAAAAAVAIGVEVKLDATGCVIVQGGTGTVKGTAEEAVDNSAGGVEAFIKIRIK